MNRGKSAAYGMNGLQRQSLIGHIVSLQPKRKTGIIFRSRSCPEVISAVSGSDPSTRCLIIEPNRSMSWQTLASLYLLMVFVSLIIGLAYYHIGLTLVLPFCGLEMLALGAALYVTSWRGSIREVVTVDEESVAVESGRDKPTERHEFQRPWTRVILDRSGGWYPSRLLLRSRGHQVEIGRFLNEEERRGLAEALEKIITPLEAGKS